MFYTHNVHNNTLITCFSAVLNQFCAINTTSPPKVSSQDTSISTSQQPHTREVNDAEARAHNAQWRVHGCAGLLGRSEEHTSELQSLMRISYAVFCLKKKKKNKSTIQ